MQEYAIVTKNIKKKYSNQYAVDGISLSIKKGEIFGLLGPNGAGKTTFLRMLSTISSISSGSGMVFGNDIEKEANNVRNLIGLTGQYATVDEDLTAFENLVLFGKLNGLSKKNSISRAYELLRQFSLIEAKDRPIKQFSGGMRRRLDLSVSLIKKPPLIFLDEPTTGLDPRTRGEMWEVIRALANEGATILLTTQYLDEADQLSDRIAVIDKGKVISEGTPEELKFELGETCFEITLVNVNDLPLTEDLIFKEIKQKAAYSPEGNKLIIKTSNTKDMIKILLRLDEKNINLKDFSVRKPTLDEVFLTLTK